MIALAPLVALLAIIVGAYYLVVRGLLFKLVLLIVGPICMWIVLSGVPNCNGTAITLGTMTLSWAAVLPLALVVLVLLTTPSKE